LLVFGSFDLCQLVKKGAGAYTGPWAEVVFGPYKGGTFITRTF